MNNIFGILGPLNSANTDISALMVFIQNPFILSFDSWDANGFLNRIIDFKDFIIEIKPDVVIVQEVKSNKYVNPKLSLLLYSSRSVSNNRSCTKRYHYLC